MMELDDLIGNLKTELSQGEPKENFKKVILEVAQFYVDNLRVAKDEVALLLANQDKSLLSFAYPEYLVDSGMIPITSTDAIAASIFNTGKSVVENNLQLQRHLSLFGIIKTPNNQIRPIWKMLGALIHTEKEKLGVIEISGRGTSFEKVTRDFTLADMDFVEETITKLSPFIKQAMPEDFRGKIK